MKNKNEKDWRAESDATMMAEYKKIMADPTRVKAAVSAAQRMAKEQAETVKAMKAVAKKKVK